MAMTIRPAVDGDVPRLMPLMDAAIEELQEGFLDDAQIESSKAIMGIDRQLIDDGTYFVVEIDGAVAGCGGWSRRATLYGGDHSAGRNAALLDPASEPARIRAMYTHPLYARRGVGRLIIETCEAAAAAEGFATIELMATRSGRPLYEAVGSRTRPRARIPGLDVAEFAVEPGAPGVCAMRPRAVDPYGAMAIVR
jgi:GNAT superfamily N-acetyltransferase